MNPFFNFVLNQTGSLLQGYGVHYLVMRTTGGNPVPAINNPQTGLVRGVATVALGNLASHPINTAGTVGRTVSAFTGTLNGHHDRWGGVVRTATHRLDTLQRQLSEVAANQVNIDDIETLFAGQRLQIDTDIRGALLEQTNILTHRHQVVLGGALVTAALASFYAYKASKCDVQVVCPELPHSIDDTIEAVKKLLEKHETRVAIARAAYWASVLKKSLVVVAVVVAVGVIIYLVLQVRKANKNNTSKSVYS